MIEWISTANRKTLPQDGQEVLVLIEPLQGRMIYMAIYHKTLDRFYCSHFSGVRPTHWAAVNYPDRP